MFTYFLLHCLSIAARHEDIQQKKAVEAVKSGELTPEQASEEYGSRFVSVTPEIIERRIDEEAPKETGRASPATSGELAIQQELKEQQEFKEKPISEQVQISLMERSGFDVKETERGLEAVKSGRKIITERRLILEEGKKPKKTSEIVADIPATAELRGDTRAFKETRKKTIEKQKEALKQPNISGFESRVQALQEREKAFFESEGFDRIFRTAGSLTDVLYEDPLKPSFLSGKRPTVRPFEFRGFVGKTAQITTAGLMSFPIAFGGSLPLIGEKIAATGEGLVTNPRATLRETGATDLFKATIGKRREQGIRNIFLRDRSFKITEDTAPARVIESGIFNPTTPQGASTFITAAGFGFLGIPEAGRIPKNIFTRLGSKRVPLEQITTKDVISGRSRFPEARSIKESIEAFRNAPKDPITGDILVTHTTTTNFPRQATVSKGGRPEFLVRDKTGKVVERFPRARGTEAERSLLAEQAAQRIGGRVERVATETEGLFVTPADKTSIQFTGLLPKESPIVESTGQIIAKPQIIKSTAKGVRRVPQSLIRREGGAFDLTNKFIGDRVGTGEVFLTPRSEKGFLGIRGGTTEIEAVFPARTRLINIAGRDQTGLTGLISRFKGYEEFVRIQGRNVPIKKFEPVIKGETPLNLDTISSSRIITGLELGKISRESSISLQLIGKSRSRSPLRSTAPSISISVSPSIVKSTSPSISRSASESLSRSISPSRSTSPSISRSASESLSRSISPSKSKAPSPSRSISPSKSTSPSPSRTVRPIPSLTPTRTRIPLRLKFPSQGKPIRLPRILKPIKRPFGFTPDVASVTFEIYGETSDLSIKTGLGLRPIPKKIKESGNYGFI